VGSNDLVWDVEFVDDLDDRRVDLAAEFFNEHFPGTYWPTCDPAVFRWKLGDSNPAGPGIMAVAMAGDVMAGVMTATRKVALIDGKPVSAVEVGDTFTNPAFRRAGRARVLAAGTDNSDHYLNKSVFGRLVNEVTDRLHVDGTEFVYGTPNNESLPGYLRRGQYHHHSEIDLSFWHRPSRPVFERKFGPTVGGLLHRTHRGLHRMLRPRSRAFSLRSFQLGNEMSAVVRELADDLWARQRPRAGFQIVQDGAYFEHRYGCHPSNRYVLHVVHEHQRAVGLVVTRSFRRVDDPGTLGIADWLMAPEAGDDALLWAIDRVADEAGPEESPSLWTDGSSVGMPRLQRMGFVRNGPIAVIRALPPGQVEDPAGLASDLRIGWSDNV